ncbi:hypothetical protein RJT34_28121 [Clitoria ternatea]|uniref:Uncharacterized protein n=1 Tax=Clitoria ternatea TaxID=43366 RepID=A0AAN9F8C7_CLITE
MRYVCEAVTCRGVEISSFFILILYLRELQSELKSSCAVIEKEAHDMADPIGKDLVTGEDTTQQRVSLLISNNEAANQGVYLVPTSNVDTVGAGGDNQPNEKPDEAVIKLLEAS